MTKYHTQDQICHLFVEQSPDCTSAMLRSGNLDFNGPTITSFGWWTLAHWTGRVNAEGKRILLFNRESSGHRGGFNSDGKQRNILNHALHGREDYVVINVNHDPIRQYIRMYRDDEPVAWRKLGEELINEEITRLKAKAKSYARPTMHVYLHNQEGNDSADIGSDISRDARIADLSVENIEARAAQFGIMGVPVTPIEFEAIKDIVRQGYAKYNDPKRVKARLAAGRRSGIISLRNLVTDFLSNAHRHRRGPDLLGEYYRGCPDAGVRGIIDRAFETHPQEAEALIRKLAERLAEHEVVEKFRLMHSDAENVVRRRHYGKKTNYLTPDEWRDGKSGTLKWDIRDSINRTFVRRENAGTTHDEVVTSRGARVPFKSAVRLYQLAANYRATGQARGMGAPELKVGHFTLNSIDAEGNCRVGCHHLDFMEMERLACKEVPHLVKARYPLPVPLDYLSRALVIGRVS